MIINITHALDYLSNNNFDNIRFWNENVNNSTKTKLIQSCNADSEPLHCPTKLNSRNSYSHSNSPCGVVVRVFTLLFPLDNLRIRPSPSGHNSISVRSIELLLLLYLMYCIETRQTNVRWQLATNYTLSPSGVATPSHLLIYDTRR